MMRRSNSTQQRRVFLMMAISFIVLLLVGYYYVTASSIPLLPPPTELLLQSMSPGADAEDLAVSPDGNKLVLTSFYEPLQLWERQTGKKLRTFDRSSNYYTSVAFSPSGKTLASGEYIEYKTRIDLWDVQSGALQRSLTGVGNTQVRTLVFSPDGITLASGGNDKTIRYWDVPTGKLLGTFTMPEEVYTVSFSSDGSVLNGGDRAGTLQQWNIRTGKLLRTLLANPQNELWDQGMFYPVAFSSDGKLMARADADKNVRLWSLRTGELLLSWPGHHELAHSIAFSPNNQLLATAGGSGQKLLTTGSSLHDLRLWDVKTGALLGKSPEDGFFQELTFAPDGKTLMTADGGRLQLWTLMLGNR